MFIVYIVSSNVNMSGLGSSEIDRELDNPVSDDESDLSIADDIPDEIELFIRQCRSGEEYEPNFSDLETSDLENQVDDEEQTRPTSPSSPTSTDSAPNVPTGNPQPNRPNRPDSQQPIWVRTYSGEADKNIENNFTTRSGIKECPPRNSAPLQYFHLFFTNIFLTMIVRETNKYAHKVLQQKRDSGNLKRFSRIGKWVDLTVNELKRYFSIIINMGLNPKKNMKKYWSAKFSQTMPFFSQAMSCNRFQNINSNLHLTSKMPLPRDHAQYDPWNKIRPVLDHFNAIFKKHFSPKQNVCIDESLIGMKNRCPFIMYLPNKKHKQYGIKKFEVCDSESAYVIHIELYTGKNDSIGMHLGADVPFTERVIMEIMSKSNLLNKSHHLFTDNYYTKIPLAENLLKKKTYITGTINKKSKYLSKSVLSAKLGERESVYFRRGDILLVGFRQKVSRKIVYVISTAAHAEDKIIRSKKGLEGMKPVLIHKYNQFMGGVDVSDKVVYHNSCNRQTTKYWKKIFWNLTDIALFNLYVLYKNNTDKPLQRAEFLEEIVESLFLSTKVEQPVPGPAGDNRGGHKMTKLDGKLERRCVICSAAGKKARSRFWCPACNVGVHRECFGDLEHFWRPTKGGRKRKAAAIAQSSDSE